MLGTPSYMAPEHAKGAELGPPADVYATAVTLYELLSGRLPFSDEGDALAVLYRHVNEAPTPIRDVAPEVPAPIADVVMRALGTAQTFAEIVVVDLPFATLEHTGVDAWADSILLVSSDQPRDLANPDASSADTPAIFFAAASSFAALKRTRLLPLSVSITACSTTFPSSVRGQAKVLSSSQWNPPCGVPPNETRCFGSKTFSSVSSRMVGFGCGVVLTSCASAAAATNRRRAAEQFFSMAAIYTPRILSGEGTGSLR